jgi:tRNA nucleotidyltransferase (CCA-adding enzyme)
VNRDKKSVRKALNEVGEDLFLSVLELKRADTLGQSEYKREQKLADLDELTEIYHEIIKDGDCISLKDLAVTGSDLIKEGYRPGPGLGEELQSLLQTVLDEPSFNQKDILLQLAKKHLAERMC